jgi:predicted transcriptional regulator
MCRLINEFKNSVESIANSLDHVEERTTEFEDNVEELLYLDINKEKIITTICKTFGTPLRDLNCKSVV